MELDIDLNKLTIEELKFCVLLMEKRAIDKLQQTKTLDKSEDKAEIEVKPIVKTHKKRSWVRYSDKEHNEIKDIYSVKFTPVKLRKVLKTWSKLNNRSYMATVNYARREGFF